MLLLSGLASAVAIAAQAGTIPTTTFNWNPRALKLDGAKFTADTMQVGDFGQIVVNSTGAFSEAGYLPVVGFMLHGQTIRPAGFNAASGGGWGVYVQYQGTGTQRVTGNGIIATYKSLSYSIYGFNGLATYRLDPTGVAYVSGGTHQTLLGDGTLIGGSLTLVPTAFQGTTPIQFAVNGDIQTTIADVPHQFSSNTFLGFDLNVVHPPGEVFVFATSTTTTTLEADGGSSSTATLIASHGNSANANLMVLPTKVPEPASIVLLAAGLVPLAMARRRRG